jgi:hypothetical protein
MIKIVANIINENVKLGHQKHLSVIKVFIGIGLALVIAATLWI